MTSPLPIVVIGAGPVGLAAAAHLTARGIAHLVLEAGGSTAHHIRDWGHVRLFSPWKYLVDPAAKSLLDAADWSSPDPEGFPTGNELVHTYLEPLAAQLDDSVHLQHRVLSVAREGLDRMRNGDRGTTPFALRVDTPEGERRILARAVIDASGTWSQPNPLGANGVEAAGESAHADSIHYGIPDVAAHPETYRGKRVLVVGSGHSAMHTLLSLVQLGGVQIAWGVRGEAPKWGGGADDELPERGVLGSRVQRAVREGLLHIVPSLSIGSLATNEHGIEVVDVLGRPRCNVDRLVVATGSRPDPSLSRELRLDLDPVTEAIHTLGPLIDPNHHSCGTVSPHGVKELTHPGEPGFFIVGMKSYGRAPTFLMLTGYEQVRSVVAELDGDFEAARRVELMLPQTGVCGVGNGETISGCC